MLPCERYSRALMTHIPTLLTGFLLRVCLTPCPGCRLLYQKILGQMPIRVFETSFASIIYCKIACLALKRFKARVWEAKLRVEAVRFHNQAALVVDADGASEEPDLTGWLSGEAWSCDAGGGAETARRRPSRLEAAEKENVPKVACVSIKQQLVLKFQILPCFLALRSFFGAMSTFQWGLHLALGTIRLSTL